MLGTCTKDHTSQTPQEIFGMVRQAILYLVLVGIASRYDPGVMEQVVRNRGMLTPPVHTAKIAVLDAEDIGKRFLVCREEHCEIAWAVDCAGIADGGYDWMVRNNVVLELDYETAMRTGWTGKEVEMVPYTEPEYQWQ